MVHFQILLREGCKTSHAQVHTNIQTHVCLWYHLN
uniref:Uncharacterized protein n=1 Tax=Anguilla anguilla TaxID=7936 RepID=A0A0E9SUB2_ANGAN